MASYFNIPLNLWERYAQEACLATDQNAKQQAEQFFYQFVQTPHIDICISLIQRGSDLLLFALFSYLYKSPQPFLRDNQNFFRIMRVVQSWQMRELNFSRPEAPLCQNYVTKTIMTALGVLMKILYENSETVNMLIKWVESLPLTYFKVYLLKNFIEAVQTIDTEMGYMRFRTMVYNFQDNVMPLICQTLVPFFQKFEEGVRISELSLMQSKLDFNDDQASYTVSQDQLSLSKEQDMQSQLVLMLLKKIVQFNYNITYTQYESQQAIDTCLITFPDKVLEKIINHQFLNSLFYVVQKVCESKIGQKKNEFLAIVLECLAKIMQSRLGYVAENNKEKFIRSAVKGLTNLLKVCQQLQNEVLLEGILICNKKLFMSVQITYIQKIINKDQQLRSRDLCGIYIRDLTQMIVQIIKISSVQVDNNLMNEALEVSCKLISSMSYKDTQNMQHQNNCYDNFVKEIIVSFVSSLCQPVYIFSSTKVIWISQNKQAVDNLFQQFKRISSYSYQTIFLSLDAHLERFLKSQTLDISILANILFLLSELVDHNYLDRNISLNKAKEQEISILANIVKKATTLATHYVQNRTGFMNNKHAHYLDIAILIFSQAILIDFLSNFESVSSIKIKQKLYLVMSLGEAYTEFVEPQDYNSESTILAYLNLIFPFLANDVVTQDMQIKMLYALQIIEKIIFKLKWNMRREVFLKCNLFKHLLCFFDEYFCKCYPNAEIMAKVGKITVTLNFDDVLDQYKFRINKFIGRLPQDNHSHIFYYLTGIFQAIQPGNICKYFCNRLKRTIDMPKFFQELFKSAIEANSDKGYKDLIRFCKLIILNKGLKTNSNSTLTYELFNLILPHLVWFISTINSSQQIDVDLLGDCISELIQLFCGVINGTHVNMFILDYSSTTQKKQEEGQSSLGVQFVMEFFQMTVILSRKLKMYPKLEESVLNCFVSINKEILEFIYDNEDSKLANIYDVVILTQIELAIDYICQQLNGNRLVQDKLLKVIDSLRLFYQFFNRKYHMVHKLALVKNLLRYEQISNFQSFDGQDSSKNEKLAFYVVSLILTNHKNNLSYIRSFSKLVFELNKHFQPYLLATFSKLNINSLTINEIRLILQEGKAEYEENFVEKFKAWVKEFNEFK